MEKHKGFTDNFQSEELAVFTPIKPQAREPYDPSVSFEEYHYYAEQTRKEELTFDAPSFQLRRILASLREPSHGDDLPCGRLDEIDFTQAERRIMITDEEWANASRALRLTSWGACFFLITTDILGPYGTGFTMGTLGWGPGIAFYTVFGIMAGYSGYLIWRVFLGVDSLQFPVRNYGDLGFRTIGRYGRFITNICQGISLLLILGQVVMLFGQNISQMSQFRLCSAVCPAIFACAGFLITQVRTLRNYGWFANLAVWLNLFVVFMTIAVMAKSPPNYSISTLGSAGSAVNPSSIKPDGDGRYPPIVHYSLIPSKNLVGAVNGMLSGVTAYAGAQLFVEFLAEMKRPRDFIKAMWTAQFFIYAVYLTYGCVIYYLQGQYSYNPSYQGVSIFAWQTVGNVVSLLAALISGGLYGNIGIKVFYNNVLLDLFKAPPITTRRGKMIYAVIVPLWWIVAFVIAAAIPDYFGFVSVVAASMLVSLTYAFPPLFALCYDVQRNAICKAEGEGFDSATGRVTRRDTSFKRWIRGFLAGGPMQVAVNTWHVIYFLAAIAMSGLGMYAAIVGLHEAFQTPQLTSFSCVSPLNLS
ncbi:hypothetical protein N7539_004177 [Penicillium diatomitis]|uniref:Amino acid transporter transmembrane domain-containing protein n=1 Tax=Penicillium diatomitis TaxID=2819901 RepID=A0A9W9XDH8_9EURO|nr:uncharacterized protein N7539_004177 [Penicillium diatomitis]KAJ5489287.1 hypothetical protein N7539_004177 [Penicillium diatomitis]